MPLRVGFAWRRTLVRREDAKAAWLWAEGEVVLTGDDGKVSRSPYRLTCVFTRRGRSWRIRLFSGSEPSAG
jgi:ketosteroid isomerase-like protein